MRVCNERVQVFVVWQSCLNEELINLHILQIDDLKRHFPPLLPVPPVKHSELLMTHCWLILRSLRSWIRLRFLMSQRNV